MCGVGGAGVGGRSSGGDGGGAGQKEQVPWHRLKNSGADLHLLALSRLVGNSFWQNVGSASPHGGEGGGGEGGGGDKGGDTLQMAASSSSR